MAKSNRSADINATATVTLMEAAKLALAVGHKLTLMLGGEPGIGKTAMGRFINEMSGNKYRFLRLDMANMSTGDGALPTFIDVEVDGEKRRMSTWAVNEGLGLHLNKPVILFLDEFTKAGQEVKNAFLPVVYDRELYGHKLPEGSIVILTGNLIDNGLGDAMKMHERNRVSYVVVRKPTAEEWINDYAIHNNIHTSIVAWIKDQPQVFESYLDGVSPPDGKGNGNPYIYHPDRPDSEAVVTPRSLEFASFLLDAADREKFKGTMLGVALAGVIGRSGAADLTNHYELALKLPDRALIYADPKNAPLPKGTAACSMITFSLAAATKYGQLDSAMAYMKRLDAELQAVFMHLFCSRKSVSGTDKIMSGLRAIHTIPGGSEWAISHNHMM